MPRLFTLGCSVTSYSGKKERLSSLLNLELINVSQKAGSNQLQIKRLIELIINGILKKDDIIYWQITADTRNYVRMRKSSKNMLEKIQKRYFDLSKNFRHYVISEFNNLFDQEERYDVLMNSPLAKQGQFDVYDELQTLLGTLILLKSYCPKILVSFGWKNVLLENNMIIFKNILTMHNIDFVEEYFVEFSKENNLEMLDDMHPAPEAGKKYAEDILFKKIKQLNWV